MPPPYHPWLCTLDYVRQHRRLTANATSDDELLMSFIEDTSAEFIETLERVPMPYLATKSFGRGHIENGYDLDLRDDLLAATLVVNGDLATISTTYSLRPDNVYPKRVLELAIAGGVYWSFLYRDSRAAITGWWGYVPHYDTTAWQDSGVDVPSGNLAANATSLVLATNQGALFETGQYLRITTSAVAEILQVTAISADTLTLARGVNGTTPAAHNVGDPIYQFHPLPDIKAAVREAVAYKYLHKDRIGSRVSVFDGGVVQVDDLSPQVQKTLDRHKVKHMPRRV